MSIIIEIETAFIKIISLYKKYMLTPATLFLTKKAEKKKKKTTMSTFYPRNSGIL